MGLACDGLLNDGVVRSKRIEATLRECVDRLTYEANECETITYACYQDTSFTRRYEQDGSVIEILCTMASS